MPLGKDLLKKWFEPNAEVEFHIEANFLDDLVNLDAGIYNGWNNDHDGRLAAILLYDQFSRKVYKNNPTAFAYDRKAINITKLALAKDVVKDYEYMEQFFLLMPYVHAEDKILTNLSVTEMKKLDKRINTSTDSSSIAIEFYDLLDAVI